MHNEITENLREVRSSLENVMVKREFLELPEEVKDRAYKALGNLSRVIQLMMFKYNLAVSDPSTSSGTGKQNNKQGEENE